MELAELQEKVDEFINEIGGYWDDYVILARLIEIRRSSKCFTAPKRLPSNPTGFRTRF